MEKYKNKTKQTLAVPGVGVVGPGEIVEAPEGFHNTNFEKVKKKSNEINIKENKNANILSRQKLSGNEAGSNGGDAGNS
jgi:hypothetical protein